MKMEYVVPIQSEERLNKINESLGTDFKSTDWHIDTLLEQFYDMIYACIEEGGSYIGDTLEVKIEMKYHPENK